MFCFLNWVPCCQLLSDIIGKLRARTSPTPTSVASSSSVSSTSSSSPTPSPSQTCTTTSGYIQAQDTDALGNVFTGYVSDIPNASNEYTFIEGGDALLVSYQKCTIDPTDNSFSTDGTPVTLQALVSVIRYTMRYSTSRLTISQNARGMALLQDGIGSI